MKQLIQLDIVYNALQRCTNNAKAARCQSKLLTAELQRFASDLHSHAL